MSVFGLVKLAIIVLAVLWAIVAWVRARVAKMAEIAGEREWPSAPGESLVDRFRRARRAVLKDEQERQAGQAYGLTEPSLCKEIAMLEDAAYQAASVAWDYPLRSHGWAGHRMYLGILAFFFVVIGLTIGAVAVGRALGVDPQRSLAAMVLIILVAAAVAFPVGNAVGGWFKMTVYELGMQLRSQGKLSSAVRRLRQAVKRSPGSLRAGYALASALRADGRHGEAAEAASQLLLGFPDVPMVYDLLGQIECARGNMVAAAHEFERAAISAKRQGAPLFAALMDAAAAHTRDSTSVGTTPRGREPNAW
jgi:hypothetical protein